MCPTILHAQNSSYTVSNFSLLLISDCSKLLCFRYYSGLNLSCLAHSEPIDFDSSYKLAPSKHHVDIASMHKTKADTKTKTESVMKIKSTEEDLHKTKADTVMKIKSSEDDLKIRSTETFIKIKTPVTPAKTDEVIKSPVNCSSESDSEAEVSSKHRKRGWRLLRKKPATAKKEESDGSDSSRGGGKEFTTWNSHETAQVNVNILLV